MKNAPVILINSACDDHQFYAGVSAKSCSILINLYAERIHEAGGIPLILPTIESPELIAGSLAHADGVLLIGGKDYPAAFFGEKNHPRTDTSRMRPDYDRMLGSYLLNETTLPVLGICAGCQLLAISDGGKLNQHLDNADEYHRGGRIHQAEITVDSRMGRIMNLLPGDNFTVNSFHHQAVLPETLHKLQVTAIADDGTVEAIELPDAQRMVLGVQFHPERMDDIAPAIFGALIDAAAQYRMNRGNHG